MTHRRRIIVLLLLGTVLVGSLFTLHRREPRFDGKSLNQWLAELGESTVSEDQKALKRDLLVTAKEYEIWMHDIEQRHATATKAIQRMGTNAIPHLLRMLHAKDSPFKAALGHLIAKQSVVVLPFRSADEDVQSAVNGFHALGDLATPAIPQLVVAINSTNYTAPDIFALVAIGSNSIPALRMLLEDKDYHMRFGTAMDLGFFGSDGQCFIPLALERLSDEHKLVRQGGIHALGNIGCEPEVAIPALMPLLNDTNATVRWEAAKTLNKFKPATNHAAAVALGRLINDPDPIVRSAARSALNKTASSNSEDK